MQGNLPPKASMHCHATKAVLYACPYANRCRCPVKFRVVKNEKELREVLLYTFDKHTPESHLVDHSSRGLKLPQKGAVQAAVRMHPMASSTDVRRNLHLVDKKRRDEVYISPAKKRTVQCEVAKEHRKVLSEFNNGEQIDRTEGSLTRMCEKIYIQKRVAEHNRPGGAHLQLHQPVCLGYQFKKGVSLPIIQLHSLCCMGPAQSTPSGRLQWDSTGLEA